MDDRSALLTTRTGFRFHVRPATRGDDGTLAGFFAHVTRDDLRFRFLNGLNVAGPGQIAALTHVDHHHTESVLAFTVGGEMMIATAIRADHKGNGIGWELLAYVARHAEQLGVHTLEAIESRDNHAAIELERDMGFTAEQYPGDASLVLVSRKLDFKTISSAAPPAIMET